MKKIISLIVLLVIVSSCTEDVKFNNPAFQSLKDNNFWRATTYKAYSDATGGIIIEGALGYEKVTLKVPSSNVQTFVLGVDNVSTASYSNSFPDQSVSFSTGANRGSGQIVITEFNTVNKTISGTFRFNALNDAEKSNQESKISFSEGVFYKIPIAVTSGN